MIQAARIRAVVEPNRLPLDAYQEAIPITDANVQGWGRCVLSLDVFEKVSQL